MKVKHMVDEANIKIMEKEREITREEIEKVLKMREVFEKTMIIGIAS
jgi:Asp-tRNA(Asn)/Glu-tRNA(Gln) amidotransferase C subunit